MTNEADLIDKAQLLDLYKAYLADLSGIGSRLTSMTTYYTSIVTALVGVLAIKEKQIIQIDLYIVMAVCFSGCVVSMLWFSGISFFRALFRAKFYVISEMEKHLTYQPFTKESSKFLEYSNRGWLKLERFVPISFFLLFLSIGTFRLVSSCVRF